MVKIYFQADADIAAAQAQVTASSQTVIKQMPTGTTPPNILVFDASSVPVLELQIAAENMTPSQINDIATNLIRPALVSLPAWRSRRRTAAPPPTWRSISTSRNCWRTA